MCQAGAAAAAGKVGAAILTAWGRTIHPCPAANAVLLQVKFAVRVPLTVCRGSMVTTIMHFSHI